MRLNAVKPGYKNIQDFTKLLITTLPAIGISACVALGPQQEPEPPEQEQPEEEVVVTPLPPDSLTPSQRVRKALQQLEQGDYENARLQLTWALQEKPTLQIATNLLEQMDVDPIDHLGMKSFFYDVEPGDSLSIIAKKFLDDPLKFVVLARYNKLENPSKLAPGQRIRVPGVMPERKRLKPKPKPKPPQPEPVLRPQEPAEALPPAATTAEQPTLSPDPGMESSPTQPSDTGSVEVTPMAAPEETEEPQQPMEEDVAATPAAMTAEGALNSARGLHGEGKLSAAIYLLENEISQHPNSEALPKLLARYYNEHADQHISQDNLEEARVTLEKLIILDTSDDQAINKLILVEDRLEAHKLMQTAQDQQSAGNLEAAYQTYAQVLTYDPDNQKAKDSQLSVRDQLTDSYHRRAMQLFRKQKLDDAIGFWNKILELNPNHSLAPGYKARALEMKQQLKKIEPGG